MKYKLVCFDIDGTLISDDRQNYWGTLHQEIEGEEEGTRIEEKFHAAFKAGEITYKDWVDSDIRGFQKAGATKEEFLRAARRHTLHPGAREAVHELKRRGYKLAVISGSLNVLIETLFPDHPFDDIFTNLISFDEDGRIASWRDTVFDQGGKHKALHAICKREGIPLAETVFVGDGENDIDILQEAGLGIAFCPKSEKVSKAADVVVTKKDVREILKYLE